MVGIDIQDSSGIEQLLVDDIEIRAICADELVFSGLCISAVEEDFHFDVVEDTQRIVDRVVADRVDGHLTYANATHDAVDINIGTGCCGKATGLVGRGVVDKRNILRIDVLTQRRLTWHQGVDAIVFETVVGNAIARHFNARTGSDGNGDKLIDDGNLGVTLVATNDGVWKANPGEKASFALVIFSLNRGEGERSLEACHVTFDTFSPRFAAQGNVSVLSHGEKGAHGQKNQNSYSFHFVEFFIEFVLFVSKKIENKTAKIRKNLSNSYHQKDEMKFFFAQKELNLNKSFLLLQQNMKIHTNHTNQTIMQEENGKYIFGVVKVGERGQIVIPKEARELYEIKPGDNLIVLGDQKGIAMLKTEVFQGIVNQAMEGLTK